MRQVFEIEVSQTLTYSAVIAIEAETVEAAEHAAKRIADADGQQWDREESDLGWESDMSGYEANIVTIDSSYPAQFRVKGNAITDLETGEEVDA